MLHTMISILILCILGSLWLIVKLYIKYNYWKNKDVHTLTPNVLFGNAKDVVLQRIPLGFDVSALYYDLKCRSKKFGGYYNFVTPVFIPVDLDLIKKMLIHDGDHFINRVSHVDEKNDPLSVNLVHINGERWKQLRLKISPFFTNSKIKMFYSIGMMPIKNLIHVVEETRLKQVPLNVKEILDRYLIDVLGLYICGTNFNSLKNENCDLQQRMTDFYNTSIIDSLLRFLITAPEILKFFKIRMVNKRTTNFFFNFVKDIMERRIKNGLKETILFDTLVQCQDASDSERNITLNEIVANIAALFLAGYETTSNTLTFCLYELASNEKIQETLRTEIKTIPLSPSYDEVSSLTYLNKCIKETLRKYPSVAISTRRCTKTFKVPDSNIVLEEGAYVYVPIQGIHWDPEYYPDPEKFDPERFTEERLKNRHACMWLPFGAGPRLCVGYKLAIFSMKVVLISLLRRYKFTLNSETQLPVRYDPNGFVLQPKNSIFLNVHKNEDKLLNRIKTGMYC